MEQSGDPQQVGVYAADVAARPKDAKQRLRWVRCLTRLGRQDEALTALSDGLVLDPASADLLAERTGLLGRMEQFEAMQASLLALADHHPDHPKLPRLRGVHAEAVGDIEAAQRIYAADAAAHPQDAARRVRWVTSLRKSGRIAEALEILGRQPSPNATERKLYVEYLLEAGQWDEVPALLDAWPDAGDWKDLLVKLRRRMRRAIRRFDHAAALGYAKAETALSAHMSLEPDSPGLLLGLWEQCRKRKSFVASEAILRMFAEHFPSDTSLPHMRAAQAEFAGDLEGAERIYSSDVAARPKDAKQRLRWVRCLTRLGRQDEALTALSDGLVLDPASADLLAERTGLLGRMEQFEAMQASLLALADHHPDHPKLPRLRGVHAEAVGDIEAAQRIYAADAAAHPQDAARRVRWVTSLRKSGRIAEALEILGRQPSPNATERKLYVEYLLEAGQWDEVPALLDAWPDAGDWKDLLVKLRRRMRRAIRRFDHAAALGYAKAETALSAHMSLEPDSPGLLLGLWEQCRKRKSFVASEAILRMFAEHFPSDTSLPHMRAAQAEFAGDLEGAERIYSSDVAARPKDAKQRLRWVRCLTRLGRQDEALTALSDGLVLDPASADLLIERTGLLGRMEQFEAMQASLLALADHHPDHPKLPRLRGVHAEAVGDVEAAQRIYAADAAAHPQDAARRVRWVTSLRKSGRIAEALEILGRQPSPNATERKLYVEYLLEAGQWDEVPALLDAWPDAEKGKDWLATLGILAERLKKTGAEDIRTILECLAVMEVRRITAPIVAGRRIVELLATDEGREKIRAASKEALTQFPDSPLLIYLHAATLAKGGGYQEAHDFAVAAIRKCQAAMASDGSTPEYAKRFDSLNKTWRIVDEISRDNMTWANAVGYGGGDDDAGDYAVNLDDAVSKGDDQQADEGGGAETETEGAQTGTEFSQQAPDSNALPSAVVPKADFVFAEGLLQGRQQDKYLQVCKQQFDAAEGLRDKLKAINAMLRQGIRRVPDYHDAYLLARHCFGQIRPQCREIASHRNLNSHIDMAGTHTLALARLLRTALQIAQRIEMASEVNRFEKALLYLARKPKAVPALWSIAATLIESNFKKFQSVTAGLITQAQREPQKEHEIRDFFLWALAAQRYDLAHDLFNTLPGKHRRLQACAQYARILQREGRFDHAATLVRQIHESLFTRPHALDPKASWALIRRAGELDFAAETANWLSQVPQPQRPEGVIFIAPRSIPQMRKFPLVVLMEMRKKGWAVVPLVKGILPLDKTNDPRIDRFLGCLTPECLFDRKVARLLKPIKGFVPDVDKGQLRWNNINLDHLVWEEAAINRRRYNIDYTCPELRKSTGRLAEWTRLTAIALENINQTLVSGGIECGFMVLQQSRLPDAVVRFYLEEFGDPDKFFCIHSANGYQNYFANFTSHVSTKTTLRNMTLHRELRSASFPVPSEFEAFYKENQARGAEMLQAVREITQIRRSTAGQTERLPEAQECLDRIRAWRNDGGKVACLFGKVVCDSAVPFDGGPAHSSMKDWLNHAIESVRGSKTLLLIKPHPHELRHEIGTFLTEYFTDLVEIELPDNVMILGHRWFDLQDLDGLIDLGVIYNGTSAAELGVLGIPCVLCGHFGPIDYPIGHAVPKSREHFRRMLRFSQRIVVAKDLKERSAAWIYFMSGDHIARDYRYHSRQITNRVVYPPWWFREDIERYLSEGDPNVEALARRAVEPSIKSDDLDIAAE